MEDLVPIAILAAAVALCVIAIRMRPLISAIEDQTKSLSRIEEALLLAGRTLRSVRKSDDRSERDAHTWLTEESS